MTGMHPFGGAETVAFAIIRRAKLSLGSLNLSRDLVLVGVKIERCAKLADELVALTGIRFMPSSVGKATIRRMPRT